LNVKRTCLALLLMTGAAQAVQSEDLDIITECVGYAAQIPYSSESNYHDYERMHQKIYDLYRKANAQNGYSDIDLGLNFATYWGVYGVSRPLIKMVKLAQSTDNDALESAAMQLWNDRNCALITK